MIQGWVFLKIGGGTDTFYYYFFSRLSFFDLAIILLEDNVTNLASSLR